MNELRKAKMPVNDAEFDSIFPNQIQNLSYRHFTSFEVSKVVAQWLNEYEKLNLLDLGCGVGKFCLAAASFTNHYIVGTDFREDYILIAQNLKDKYGLKNLDFVNRNILDVDFKKFNAFYLFNPFLEQIDDTARMDNKYDTSPLYYSIYENHVRARLQEMPVGTVVITYYVTPQQMPFNYVTLKTDFDGFLKLWTKK